MRKALIVIVVLLLLGVIVYLISKNNKEQYFLPEPIGSDNIISNKTDIKYLDTIVAVGMGELSITGKYIMIREMSSELKSQYQSQNGIELSAYIVGQDPQYLIYTNKTSRSESITILAHELIHLQQYSSGRLVNLGGGKVVWEGDTINVNTIPYNDRAWEKEAFDGQNLLQRKMNFVLYGK